MKTKPLILVAALAAALVCRAFPSPSSPDAKQSSNDAAAPGPGSDSEARADRRYDEMLGKMQAAVEEIAQLYGNPVFLQVFTNDEGRAAELKERLRAGQTGENVRSELSGLQKKRDDLLNDIALKEREANRLTGRLVRQRAALDELAAAVEQARKAVEETSK